MAQLNQIIAVEKGVRAKATRSWTDAHRAVQQVDRLSGIARTYQPRDAEGETLPPESTLVQFAVETVNADVASTLSRLFDVVAVKDYANTRAKADVVVDGAVLLTDVPVPYLLFLEKELVGLRTYVDKLPTLDPALTWTPDAVSGVYRADPVKTVKTRKVPKNHVLAAATDKHPAQVQIFTEDVVIGDWTTTKFSGAITQERRLTLLERVDKLANAVKFAREQANGIEVTDIDVGGPVFDYLFA